MAHHNELTDIAIAELKLHNIKGHLRDTNGGHIEITWQVVPEKEVRQIFVAKTTSDWRSRLNTRAEVRRLLRADNVAVKVQNEKPQRAQQIVKALSLPTEQISVPDQVKALRAELADLTELVLRLTKITTTVRDNIGTYVPPPPKPAPLSSRSVKVEEYLSHDRWVTITGLIKDTGLSPEQIKLKLNYLKTHGRVDIFRNEVKLHGDVKPANVPPKQQAAANGHRKPGRPKHIPHTIAVEGKRDKRGKARLKPRNGAHHANGAAHT